MPAESYLTQLRRQSSGGTPSVSDQEADAIRRDVDTRLAKEEQQQQRSMLSQMKDEARRKTQALKESGYTVVHDPETGEAMAQTAPNGERVRRIFGSNVSVGEQTGEYYKPDMKSGGLTVATGEKKIDRDGRIVEDLGRGIKRIGDLDEAAVKRKNQSALLDSAEAELRKQHADLYARSGNIGNARAAARKASDSYAGAKTLYGENPTDPKESGIVSKAKDEADAANKTLADAEDQFHKVRELSGKLNQIAVHRRQAKASTLPADVEKQYADIVNGAKGAPAAPAQPTPAVAAAQPAPPPPPIPATPPAPVTPEVGTNPTGSAQSTGAQAAAQSSQALANTQANTPGQPAEMPKDATVQPPPAAPAAPAAPVQPAPQAAPAPAPEVQPPTGPVANPEDTAAMSLDEHGKALEASSKTLEANSAALDARRQQITAPMQVIAQKKADWQARSDAMLASGADSDSMWLADGTSITFAAGMKDELRALYKEEQTTANAIRPQLEALNSEYDMHRADVAQHQASLQEYQSKIDEEQARREADRQRVISDLRKSPVTSAVADRMEQAKAEHDAETAKIEDTYKEPAQREAALKAAQESYKKRVEGMSGDIAEAANPLKRISKEQDLATDVQALNDDESVGMREVRTPEDAKAFGEAMQKRRQELQQRYGVTADQFEKVAASVRSRPYSVDEEGNLQFTPASGKDDPTPDVVAKGFEAAVKDGVLDESKVGEMRQKLDAAKAEWEKVVAEAGDNAKAKAALRGALKGGAFIGGATLGTPLGAKGGAALATAMAGPEAAPVGAAVGGTIGALTGGTIASAGADKLLNAAGRYVQAINSINQSAAVHPGYAQTGELAAFIIAPEGLTSPKLFVEKGIAAGLKPAVVASIENYAKLGSIAADGVGKAGASAAVDSARAVAAADAVLKSAAGSVGGAVAFTGAQYLFDAGRYAVADLAGIKHDQLHAPGFADLATNVGLGLLLHGRSLTFRDYSPAEVASILTRAKVRNDAGIDLKADATPDTIIRAFKDAGVDLDASGLAEMGRPLTAEDVAVYESAKRKTKELQDSGEFANAGVEFGGAVQGNIPDIFGRKGKGTPIASSVVNARPNERMGGGGEGEAPKPGAPTGGQPAALPEVSPEARQAASDTELQSGGADSEAVRKATVLRDIGNGADLRTMTEADLNTVGLTHKGGDIKPLTGRDPRTGQPYTPSVQVDDKGRAIILQPAIDDLRANFPATSQLVTADETQIRQRYADADKVRPANDQPANAPATGSVVPRDSSSGGEALPAASGKGNSKGAAPSGLKGAAPAPELERSLTPTGGEGDKIRKWGSQRLHLLKGKGRTELIKRIDMIATELDAYSGKFSGGVVITNQANHGKIFYSQKTDRIYINPVKMLKYLDEAKNDFRMQSVVTAALDEEYKHQTTSDLYYSDAQFRLNLDKVWDALPDELKALSAESYFKREGARWNNDEIGKFEFFRQYWQRNSTRKLTETALREKGLIGALRALLARFIRELQAIAKGTKHPELKAILDRLIAQGEEYVAALKGTDAYEARRRSKVANMLRAKAEAMEQVGGESAVKQAEKLREKADKLEEKLKVAETPSEEPSSPSKVETVDEQAHEAATSPKNDLAEPTDAQKEAGNYPKGHVTLAGMDISIENPAGSKRRPEWPELRDHYGYFRGTVGRDKDHVDVFIKPGTPLDYEGPVFVVNQVDPSTRKFDETKVIIGATDKNDAYKTYRRNYSENWKGYDSLAEFPDVASFKEWLYNGDHSKKVSNPAKAETVKTGEGPKTDVPQGTAEAPKVPDKPKTKLTNKNLMTALRGYFTVGAIVPSYGGQDRVVAFHGDSPANWNVDVVAVDKEGRDIPGERVRNHMTMPKNEELLKVLNRPEEASNDTKPQPKPTISKGDWVTYKDSFGKEHTGKVESIWKIGSIRPGVTEAPMTKYSVVDAAGNYLPSPEGPVTKTTNPTQGGQTEGGAGNGSGASTSTSVASSFETPVKPNISQPAKPATPPKSGASAATIAKGRAAFEGLQAPGTARLETSNPAGQQIGLPRERRGQFMDLADSLIEDGITEPSKLVQYLNEIRPDGALQKYAQALWNYIGTADPSLSGTHDWEKLSQPQGKELPEGASVQDRIANYAQDTLLAGKPISTRSLDSLLSMAGKLDPNLTRKQIDEAVELGITKAARAIVQRGADPQTTFNELVKLYENQPVLGAKTSTSKVNQAFSTPAPLAFAASVIGDITGSEVVIDSTSGNGMLTIATTPEQRVIVNELDPKRIERLKLLNPALEISNSDATTWIPPVLGGRGIANPPFGAILAENGQPKQFDTPFGKTTQIDHAIVAQLLTKDLKPGARVTFIIGGPAPTVKTDANRAAFYSGGIKGEFYKWLYDNHRVIDHFTLSGDLYKKQGAGWSVDVITVSGEGRSPLALPTLKAPRMLDTWKELADELTRTDTQRIELGKYSAEQLGQRVDQLADALGGLTGPTPEVREGSGVAGNANVPSAGGNAGSGKSGGTDVAGRPAEVPSARSGDDAAGAGKPVEGHGTSESGGRSLPRSDRERELADENGETFQKPYVSGSGVNPSGLLAPVNLVLPMSSAMDRLKAKVGDLEPYVAKELGYAKDDPITRYYYGEQIDALALAIDNFKNGGALVIGDQTGTGKGRIAAGLLRYAVNNGHVPIFVTKNQELYEAMLNDLADVNAAHVIPAITDNVMKSEQLRSRRLPSGKEVFEDVAKTGDLPAGTNAVFTTYDQIKNDTDPTVSKKDRAQAKNDGEAPKSWWRMAALKRIAPKALIVLDESHLASGKSTTGYRFGDLLRNLSRVYYSSATFAKRPENMGIYFKTRLGQMSGGNLDSLIELMEAGGVPAMQVASSMLAEDGQYMRRERGFEGVGFRTHINTASETRDRQLADSYTTGLREIVHVQDAMQRAANAVNAMLAAIGKKYGIPQAQQARLESSNFSAKLHNLIRQYLLAIKANSVADMAIDAIKNGHPDEKGVVKRRKVVVAVDNTMESVIESVVSGGFQPSFIGALGHYLNQMRDFYTGGAFNRELAFRVTDEAPEQFKNTTDEDLRRGAVITTTNEETGERVLSINEPVVQEMVRRAMSGVMKKAQDVIRGLDLGGMPLSPIDAMRQRVEEAGIKTDEITGRKLGLTADGKTYERTAKEIKDKIAVLDRFNNKDTDFVVINQSGSTGISMHASEKFKNKTPRLMIVAQANLDINEYMQMLGRIHRSGQIANPDFVDFQTALAAEKRPAAVRGRKMAMLNANTTSNAESEVSGGGAQDADLFNEYGDEVVHKYLRDNPRLADQIALSWPKLYGGVDGNALLPLGDFIQDENGGEGYLSRSVTGHLAILPTEEQDAFWDSVQTNYNGLITYLDAIGQNKLKAQNLDIKAKTIASEMMGAGAGSGESVFDRPAYIETVESSLGEAPITAETAMNISDELRPKAVGVMQDYIHQTDAAIAAKEEEKARKSITDWSKRRDEWLANQHKQRDAIASSIANIGRIGTIKRPDGSEGHALLQTVHLDEKNLTAPSAQMFYFKVNDARGTMKIPGSQVDDFFTPINYGEKEAWERTWEFSTTRHIITGNLLEGLRATGTAGKIITYTTDAGDTKTGILLPSSFTRRTEAENEGLQTVTSGDDLLEKLKGGWSVFNPSKTVQFAHREGRTGLKVPASRSEGGKFWRNPELNRLTKDGEFVQRGNWMQAEIPEKNVGEVYDFIRRSGETLNARPPEKGVTLGAPKAAGSQPTDADEIRALYDALGVEMPDDAVLNAMLANAAGEAPGEKVTGDQILANMGMSEEARIADRVGQEVYRDLQKSVTIPQIREAAAELLKKDAAGVERSVLEAYAEGRPFEDAVLREAAKMLFNRKVAEAANSGDMAEAAKFSTAYHAVLGEVARILGTARDSMQTPRERAQDFILENLSTPMKVEDRIDIEGRPSSVQKSRRIADLEKQIEDAEGADKKALTKALEDARRQLSKEEQTAKILKDQTAEIKKALKQAGNWTIDDVTGRRVQLRAAFGQLVVKAIGEGSAKREHAVDMIVHGFPTSEIARFTGYSPLTIDAMRDTLRENPQPIYEALADLIQSGKNVDELASMIRGNVLGAAEAAPEGEKAMSRAEALKQAMELISPDDIKQLVPSAKEAKGWKKVDRQSKAKQKASPDAVADRWIDRLATGSKKEHRDTQDTLSKLIQQHRQSAVADFVDRAHGFGIDREKAEKLDALITDARQTQGAKPEKSAVQRAIERLEKAGAAAKPPRSPDALRDLINQHRRTPMDDFTDRLRALGVPEGEAQVLTSLMAEDAKRRKLVRDARKESSKKPTIEWNPLEEEYLPFDAEDEGHVVKMARAVGSPNTPTLDMVQEFWINSLLSGTKTLFTINNIGNITNGLMEMMLYNPIERALGAVAQAGAKAVGGEYYNELTPRLLEPVIKGAMRGFATGIMLANKAFVEERDVFDHTYGGESGHGIGGMEKYDNQGAIPGLTGKILRTPSRILLWEDQVFKTTLAHVEVGRRAYRRGLAEGLRGGKLAAYVDSQVNDPASIAWVEAARFADEVALQDHNAITDLISALTARGGDTRRRLEAEAMKQAKEGDMEGARKTAKRIRQLWWREKIGKFIIPFSTVASNIFRYFVKRSPIGTFTHLLPATVNAARGRGAKGDVVRHLASQLVAWSAYLLLRSMVEGDKDDDKKRVLLVGSAADGRRDLVNRTQGGTNRAVFRSADGARIGVLDFSRIEYAGTVLSSMIDAIRLEKTLTRAGTDKAQQAAQVLLGMVASMASRIEDQPFMRGPAQVARVLDSAQKASTAPGAVVKSGQRLLTDILGGFDPNIVRATLRDIDPKKRDYNNAEWWYSLVPHESGAHPMIDLNGREQIKEGNAITRLLWPAGIQTGEVLPSDKWLEEFNRDKTGSTGIKSESSYYPRKPAPGAYSFKDTKGKQVPMTADQREAFDRRAGELYQRLLGTESKVTTEEPTGGFTRSGKDAKRRVVTPVPPLTPARAESGNPMFREPMENALEKARQQAKQEVARPSFLTDYMKKFRKP